MMLGENRQRSARPIDTSRHMAIGHVVAGSRCIGNNATEIEALAHAATLKTFRSGISVLNETTSASFRMPGFSASTMLSRTSESVLRCFARSPPQDIRLVIMSSKVFQQQIVCTSKGHSAAATFDGSETDVIHDLLAVRPARAFVMLRASHP